jgi:hypothetical protein
LMLRYRPRAQRRDGANAERKQMSEQKTFEAQGRAHAKARQLQSDIAVLTVSLREKATVFSRVNDRIQSFLGSPLAHSQGRPVDDGLQLAHDLRHEHSLLTGSIAKLVDEVYTKSRDLAELQKQIDRF